MSLVTMKSLLEGARSAGIGIGAFNVGNLEMVKGAVQAAEELNFELAAALRDRLLTVQKLGQKQLVTAGQNTDTDVIGYGEQVQTQGLNMLYGPGNDLVSSTALTAAGAHIILFTTGRGTPFGAPAPTVKIATNTPHLFLTNEAFH